MTSSHLLRVLCRTCNYRQTYLSRTLPLYTGVFRRHFFSDTPIRSSQSSSEATLPITYYKPVRKKRGRFHLSEEDEVAFSGPQLNLPPIERWRQFFSIMEGHRLRLFLRNPDTARMLAEAFVPEGSKDLIVIEAASGMYSYFVVEVLVIQPSNRSWAVNKSTS